MTWSYDRVAAFARAGQAQQQEASRVASNYAYVPLVFAPGEVLRFDWCKEWTVLDGQSSKLQISQFKLSDSREMRTSIYQCVWKHLTYTSIGGALPPGLIKNANRIGDSCELNYSGVAVVRLNSCHICIPPR